MRNTVWNTPEGILRCFKKVCNKRLEPNIPGGWSWSLATTPSRLRGSGSKPGIYLARSKGTTEQYSQAPKFSMRVAMRRTNLSPPPCFRCFDQGLVGSAGNCHCQTCRSTRRSSVIAGTAGASWALVIVPGNCRCRVGRGSTVMRLYPYCEPQRPGRRLTVKKKQTDEEDSRTHLNIL